MLTHPPPLPPTKADCMATLYPPQQKSLETVRAREILKAKFVMKKRKKRILLSFKNSRGASVKEGWDRQLRVPGYQQIASRTPRV